MGTSVYNVIKGILPSAVHVSNKIHYVKLLITTMGTVKHVGKVIFLLEEIVKSNSKLQLQTNKMMIFIA